MQNPFTLTFGKSPLEPVERPVQTNEIVDAFTAESVNQQMFIITGVRGSGKTVMMTEIARRLREKENWVVIELNPSTDLLQAMLAKLNSTPTEAVRLLVQYVAENGRRAVKTLTVSDSEEALLRTVRERLANPQEAIKVRLDEL